MSLDPSPESVIKIAQNFTPAWIGSAISGLLLFAGCVFTWWKNEPKKGDMSNVSEEISKHEALTNITEIKLLLKDIHLEICRSNEGIEYIGQLYEATYNKERMTPPVRRPRKR